MKKYPLLAVVLTILLVSSACYFPTNINSEAVVATEVQRALQDILDETATVNAAATYTPYPTYTPAPTYTPQATAWYAPYYDQYIPSDSGGRRSITNYCNSATFVTETITDNTVFNPGDTIAILSQRPGQSAISVSAHGIPITNWCSPAAIR